MRNTGKNYNCVALLAVGRNDRQKGSVAQDGVYPLGAVLLACCTNSPLQRTAVINGELNKVARVDSVTGNFFGDYLGWFTKEIAIKEKHV